MKNTSLPFMMRRKVDLRKAKRKSVHQQERKNERQGLLSSSNTHSRRTGKQGPIVKVQADIGRASGRSDYSDYYGEGDEQGDYAGPTSRHVSRTERGW
jgi:hypothetical protein